MDLRAPGLAPFRRARRGLVVPQKVLHNDTWDRVLCEGVPVSLRELVTVTAEQLKLRIHTRNLHKLLECEWNLG